MQRLKRKSVFNDLYVSNEQERFFSYPHIRNLKSQLAVHEPLYFVLFV